MGKRRLHPSRPQPRQRVLATHTSSAPPGSLLRSRRLVRPSHALPLHPWLPLAAAPVRHVEGEGSGLEWRVSKHLF